MLPVGVTWGFRTREELEESGARVLIDRPAELLTAVSLGRGRAQFQVKRIAASLELPWKLDLIALFIRLLVRVR